MIKKLKNSFFKKCQFLHFLQKLKVKNCFLKKQPFSILIISLVTIELNECTIPQIKGKNISFGPYAVNWQNSIPYVRGSSEVVSFFLFQTLETFHSTFVVTKVFTRVKVGSLTIPEILSPI